MKTTVVLSTYNGEKYLSPLLDSLRRQSVPIDEVLIFDDCSSDDTAILITEYITKYNLENWKFRINRQNIGWEDNFWQGIKAADGDLIFPCDQDDVWELNKIEKMVEAMNVHDDILVMASDYKVLYMDSAVKFPGTRLLNLKDDGSFEKITCNRGVLVVDRPGCTYCIRKALIPTMELIRFEKCPHDALAWRAGWLKNGLGVLHCKTIVFRRHGTNASDKKEETVSGRLSVAEYYVTMLGKILESGECTPKQKTFVYSCLSLQLKRVDALKKRKIWSLMFLFCRLRYYTSLRTYLGDVYSMVKEYGFKKRIS